MNSAFVSPLIDVGDVIRQVSSLQICLCNFRTFVFNPTYATTCPGRWNKLIVEFQYLEYVLLNGLDLDFANVNYYCVISEKLENL